MDRLPDGAVDTWGGALVLLGAVVQLAASGRRDLGGVTVALGAAAWLLVGGVTPPLGTGLALAAPVAAAAWWRGAARGVGRPELVGKVLATAVIAAVVTALSPDTLPLGQEAVRGAGVGAIVLAGVVAALLSGERRGLAGQRVYHWREVPVQDVARRPPEAP